MTDSILAQQNLPIYGFMVVASLWTIAMLAITLVMLVKGPAFIRAVGPWLRKTFSHAGDGCPSCGGWSATVHCLRCNTTRVMTPTATIPTPREFTARQRDRGLTEIQRATQDNLGAMRDIRGLAQRAFQRMRRTTGAVN